MKTFIYRFILCGAAGWCMECLWTGICALFQKDPVLTCRTSLWMFPIYGMAAFIYPISLLLQNQSFFIRGLIYMIFIYLAEYITGFILQHFHVCPWYYGAGHISLNGLICLEYAPLWFLAGLFFEWILHHAPIPA